MTEYDNTNRGIMSRDQKRTNDKAPEFTGTLNVAGTEYRIAAWVKERKDGSGKFFSLSVSPKEESYARPSSAERAKQQAADDDIPF
jgi:hypothetical protein